jgi:sulfopropanediol 3-dehydrogenase
MADYLKQAPLPSTQAPEEVRRTVSEMLLEIERRGADAIRDYSRKLDNFDPPSFRVTDAEIAAAADQLSDDLKHHIHIAQAQVRGFAQHQRATLTDLEVETLPGVVLGHRHIPVGNVGSYVPGGRYPMLASAFMTVLVPKVAGVPRVVAVAPPREGKGIHPAMLYAMSTSGADEIVALGGVQALAALAFGLGDDLDPVDMICGAGNAYVAEAKRQLYGRVGIDLLAGPTEVLVLADGSADPELVAADLLGQAEHGPTSPAILVTTSRDHGAAVLAAVERLLATTWPTAEVAGAAWANHGSIIVAADDAELLAIANDIASEHVEIQAEPATLERWFAGLDNFGSLFVGENATVAYGDKGVGTNHVLPTSRAARYTGGLWVGKFLKTCTYQRLTDEGTRQIAPTIEAVCAAEMMLGHGVTATMRLERVGR